jgi:hypothetical protein
MTLSPFSRRSFERLTRELSVFEVDLAKLCGRDEAFARSVDAKAAEAHMQSANNFKSMHDIEGAWAAIHAAQRAAVVGFTSEEVDALAIVLRSESSKVFGWRGDAISRLLDRTDVESLQAAMRVRDELSANTYHKIWLVTDQLLYLSCASLLGLLLLVPVALFAHRHGECLPPEWGGTLLCAVIGMGLCGGCFSVSLSMFANMNETSLPERTANIRATTVRAMLGTVAGVAGYALSLADVFHFVAIPRSISWSVSVAFIFGYAGEVLINRVVRSLSKK